MQVGMIVLTTVVSLCFVVGCATGYHRNGLTGGFSETMLSYNTFQVNFSGNGFTNGQRVADFALLRSAELALKNGFDFFQIVNVNNHGFQSFYTTPVQASTNYNSNILGSAYSYGNSTSYTGSTHGTATTTFTGGQTYTITKPSSTNTVVCYRKKPEGQGFVYEAKFIVKSLKEKYKIK